MTSKQYEELCRFFLSRELKLPIDKIESAQIENPLRPGEPEYAHQIDLYWEVEDELVRIKQIANAKWHKQGACVELAQVLLLQKIRAAIGAHAAVLITNTGYHQGARAAAINEGVALHVVRPNFNYQRLHPDHAGIIRRQIQELARRAGSPPLYTHVVVHKGLGPLSEKQ